MVYLALPIDHVDCTGIFCHGTFIFVLLINWYTIRHLYGNITQYAYMHVHVTNCMMTSSNGNKIPRYWPFVLRIHRSPVNSPYKGQWRGALVFSLICVWINGWENNREADYLRRYRAHYDVIVMCNIRSCMASERCVIFHLIKINCFKNKFYRRGKLVLANSWHFLN